MCGIVGIFRSQTPVDRDRLIAACRAIEHRGPDASEIFADSNVGMGHQRLKIIDLSDSSNQPMTDCDDRAVLVFNGEIYNYRELRDQLVQLGHVFYTASDTEVLLHMYLQYGKGCLRHLRGMFAFAIWDKRSRSLFLARDRMGIKPLYYYSKSPGMFCFASEIKALLALHGELFRDTSAVSR